MNNNLEKLSEYLENCNKKQITLSIEDIETITCTKLPDEALKSEWWWNISSSKRAKYWLSVGYKTIDAKYIPYRRNVTFKKIEDNETLKKENSIIYRFIYFLCNENNPTRKKIAAVLVIPATILSILGAIYTIKGYYINNSMQDTLENSTFNYLYEIGIKHLENQNYEEAIKYLESSLNTYDNLNIPYSEDTLKVLNVLGNTYLKITLYDKAIDNYIKAISIIDNLDIDKENYFDIYINIAYAYVRLTAFDKAEKYLDIAKNYFNDDEISSFEQSMIFIHLEYYINEENEDDTNRVALDFDLPDEENPMHFDVNRLSRYLDIVEIEAAMDMRKGNLESAAFHYEEILSFWDYLKTYNIYDNDYKIAILYDSISICNIYLGEIEKAQKYNQLAVEFFDNQFGNRNIDTGISYCNMGIAYLEVGEYKKAYDYLSKSATIIQYVLGENNDMMATIYNNIGSYFDYIGNHEQAEIYFLKSLNIYIYLDIQNINTIKTYINYSLCLINMNKLSEAQENIDKAYLLASILIDENTEEYQSCIKIKNYLQNLSLK